LASLEDQDLRLESTKLQGRKSQLQREYRAAIASHDRTKVAVLKAQMDQIQAELDRANALLARTRIVAPFEGVVVSGDLSQALGAPVERGQVLLEIAPLDAYRVVLETDERDLEYVSVGQTGQLVLAAHPGRHYPVTVQSITPVATTHEGKTFFRVEARMEQDAQNLRPRMDGVAKLHVGERTLLWTWTRRLVDTLSLWLWTHWQ
jgi:multidrug resistance efflux pump